MEPIVIGVIAVVVLLALLFLGVHVAVAMGLVGLFGLVIVGSLDKAIIVAAHTFYTTASSYALSVLPLFIIMGHLAASAGVVEKAYGFARRWLSNLPAGLYLVITGSCALFAAATGSAAATTIAIGRTILPEMQRLGYNRRLSVATVAASGTLGVLIPPSIPLVIYGILTEESIGRLLIAGVIPGIVSAIIYMLGVSLLIYFRPKFAPPVGKYNWKERFQSIPGVWGVAILFCIVIGGIYIGVFTPTEAAAFGALATLVLLALSARKRFLREAKTAGWEAVGTAAMIFFILLTAILFSTFLTYSGTIDTLMSVVTKGVLAPWAIIAFFIAISIIMGMFMAATAALVLVAPIAHAILTPLGFDGIWLGIIMIKLMELAFITPPIGVGVYVAKSLVPDLPLEEIFKGVTIFVVLDIITIAILVIFPQISLWLPTMAFG